MSEDVEAVPEFDVGRVLVRALRNGQALGWRLGFVLIVMVGAPQFLTHFFYPGYEETPPVWLMLPAVGLALFSQGVLTVMSLDHSRRRPVRLTSALKESWGMAASMLCLLIVQLLFIGAGFILLVVPGLYLIAAWAAALPLMIVDGGGIIRVLRETPYVTEGRRMPVLGSIIIVDVIALAPTWLIYELAKLADDPERIHGLLLEPVGWMLWIAGQGLLLPAIFHEMWWGGDDSAEERAAEVFE